MKQGLVATSAVAAAILLSACGSSAAQPSAPAPADTARSYFDALKKLDCTKAMGLLTAPASERTKDASRLCSDVQTNPIRDFRIGSTHQSGDHATVDVTLTKASGVVADHADLVRDGGKWLISDVRLPDQPEGTAVLEMDTEIIPAIKQQYEQQQQVSLNVTCERSGQVFLKPGESINCTGQDSRRRPVTVTVTEDQSLTRWSWKGSTGPAPVNQGTPPPGSVPSG